MALVNVNRKNTDQFYRYKMPRLLAKVNLKLHNMPMGWRVAFVLSSVPCRVVTSGLRTDASCTWLLVIGCCPTKISGNNLPDRCPYIQGCHNKH